MPMVRKNSPSAPSAGRRRARPPSARPICGHWPGRCAAASACLWAFCGGFASAAIHRPGKPRSPSSGRCVGPHLAGGVVLIDQLGQLRPVVAGGIGDLPGADQAVPAVDAGVIFVAERGDRQGLSPLAESCFNRSSTSKKPRLTVHLPAHLRPQRRPGSSDYNPAKSREVSRGVQTVHARHRIEARIAANPRSRSHRYDGTAHDVKSAFARRPDARCRRQRAFSTWQFRGRGPRP
jgi:hypothetical protein